MNPHHPDRPIVHVDVETRSAANINDGVQHYAMHPSTSILCLSYAIGAGEALLWVPGDVIPVVFTNPCARFIAWNAEFEIAIFEHVLTKLGWPTVPDNQWQCAQSDALALGLPAKLSQCGEVLSALGLQDFKDSGGKDLIKHFCLPKTALYDVTLAWNEPADHPQAFAELCAYCQQDVRTERAIHELLPAHATAQGSERQYYLNTVQMNRRGVPVNVSAVDRIQARIDEYTESLTEELAFITNEDIQTANQTQKIKSYVKKLGLDLPDLQALTVENALDDKNVTGVARRILEIRHTVGKASVKKFKSMRRCVCPDHTIKNNHIYHKASTGRYAGVNTQFQNLAQQRKGVIKNPKFALESFLKHSDETIAFIHGGDVSDLAKDLVRSVIQAPTGVRFLCADFKGVEARGTAWACGEQDRIDVFRSGRDIYRVNAAGMYGIDYEDIKKGGEERQAGKINELLGGYQGGWKAILKGAKKYKIDLGAVCAESLVRTKTRYEIEKFCEDQYRNQIWCDCRIKDPDAKNAEVAIKVADFLQKMRLHLSSLDTPGALQDFCERGGFDLARAKASKDNKAYRASRPKLTAAWRAFQDAAFQACENPGTPVTVPDVKPAIFELRGAFLFLKIPSGRELCYPFPEIRDTETDWGEKQKSVTVRTLDSGKWIRRGMYGGKWFQNYIQALCRDLLFHGQETTERAGYPWILSVHDEGLVMVPQGSAHTLEHFGGLLTQKEPWAEGFPLEYDGWEGLEYHK